MGEDALEDTKETNERVIRKHKEVLPLEADPNARCACPTCKHRNVVSGVAMQKHINRVRLKVATTRKKL